MPSRPSKKPRVQPNAKPAAPDAAKDQAAQKRRENHDAKAILGKFQGRKSI